MSADKRGENQKQNKPWCMAEITRGRLRVRFGGLERDDFAAMVQDFRDLVPAGLREWNADDRCWIVDLSQSRKLRDWALEWFDSVGWPLELSTTSTPWSTLWLLPGAPREVIRAAFRALARLHHPDIGGDTAAMQRITAAYDELMREEEAQKSA